MRTREQLFRLMYVVWMIAGAIAPTGAEALTVNWKSGEKDIVAGVAASCTLVVQAGEGKELPGEWRLTWAAVSADSSPIRPVATASAAGVATTCSVRDSNVTGAGPIEYATVEFCGDQAGGRSSVAWYVLEVAAGTRATLKVAWMEPGGIGVVAEDQATINGGAPVPLAPTLLSTEAVSDSGKTILWAAGTDLSDVVAAELSPAGGEPVPASLTKVTKNYLTGVAPSGSVPGGSAFGVVTATELVEAAPISESAATARPAYSPDQIIVHLAPGQGLIPPEGGGQADVREYKFTDNRLPSTLLDAGILSMAPLLPWFSHADTLSTNLLGERVALADMADYYLAKLSPGVDPASVARQLAWTPGVVSAQVDPAAGGTTTPNDPLLPQQWYLRNVGQYVCDAPVAPNVDIGGTTMWYWPAGAPSVNVGILDSGIDYTHRELAPYVQVDTAFIDPPSYIDGAHHGTPIAGIVGAVRDEAFGVAGIASGVRLVSMKMLGDNNRTWVSQMICAIDRARVLRLPIVNMSWGTLPPSYGYSDTIQALQDVTYNARLSGCLLVAASGNAPVDRDLHEGFFQAFPATLGDRVLTVGAVLPDGLRWNDARIAQNYCAGAPYLQPRCWASNFFGNTMDLSAPGGRFITTTFQGPNVETTLAQCQLFTLSNTAFGGTSAAAPMVSGVAAVLMSLNPSLTADDAEFIMKATARQTDPNFLQHQWNQQYGYGVVRADSAVEYISRTRILQNGCDLYAASGPGLHVVAQDVVAMRFDDVFGWGTIVSANCTRYTLEDSITFDVSFDGAVNAWLRVSGTSGLDPRVRYYAYTLADPLRGGQIMSLSTTGTRFRTAVYNVPGHGWFPNAPEAARVAWSVAGNWATTGVAEREEQFGLAVRTVPNPARAEVALDVSLPSRALLDAAIYDVGGRRVGTLGEGVYGPGTVRFRWRPNGGSSSIGAGVYFCRVNFGNQSLSRRFVLLQGNR